MVKNKKYTAKQKVSYRQHVFQLVADYQKSLSSKRLQEYREMMFSEWLINVGAVDIPSIEEWTEGQFKKHR